jgi:uncharacterized protein YdeI (YjbR/CyaY-like superfamily)
MSSSQDQPVVAFASQAKWKTWLAVNHAVSAGLWVKIAKKEAGIATVSYDEALIVALCYGWIDGQKKSFDAQHWLQRFTPRTARSRWSKINCAKALALIESGQMQPAGLREVERARKDGRWDAAYEGQSVAQVPDDLQRALNKKPAAKAFFATLDGRNRYAILYRIAAAKKPETRAQRIKTFVAMLAENEKIHP